MNKKEIVRGRVRGRYEVKYDMECDGMCVRNEFEG